MSRTIAVCAVTGRQGRSVVEHLVKDGTFKVRGLVRDVNSESAKSIAALGVDIVKADHGDPASLEAAFQGVEGVYAYVAQGPDERQYGLNIADAAKKAGVMLLIWSSAQSAKASGPYDVPSYEDKAAVWEHIQKESIPAVQFYFGIFLETFTEFHWLKAPQAGSTDWSITVPILSSDKPVPVSWIQRDLGQSALVVFKHYQTRPGLVNETFGIGLEKVSLQYIGETISAAAGVPIKNVTLPEEVLRKAGFGKLVDAAKLMEDGKLLSGFDVPSAKLVELGLEPTTIDEWVETVIKPFIAAQST